MEKRTITSVGLAVSGAAVLLSVLILLVRVKSAAPPPVLGPGEITARAPADPGADRGPLDRPSPRLEAPRLPPTAGAAAPAPQPEPLPVPPPPAPTPAPPSPGQNVLDQQLAEATEFYDRGDYPNALERAVAALQQLREHPNPDATERVLRIAASSSCFLGEAEQARLYHDQLTPRGQRDIEKRCHRVGIELR